MTTYSVPRSLLLLLLVLAQDSAGYVRGLGFTKLGRSTQMICSYCCQTTLADVAKERNGSGVELRTLDYENPGSNPVQRC